MKILFHAIFMIAFFLVTWPGPATGQDMENLQVIKIEGRFLDPSGNPMEEYDYLEARKKYRLMPGARVELTTLDGRYGYPVVGPGILSFDRQGPVTLNGEPLTPSTLHSPLQTATAAGVRTRELGGIRMRGQKGVQVEAVMADGRKKVVPLYSGYHALVVGCGAYESGWPRLPNPVQDAKDVAGMLKNMGWKVDLLLDPKWDTLRKALNALITGPGRDEDKAVMVWFSGHGHTLAEVDGSKLGYIVPVDAPDPDTDEMGFMERAISMRQIETVACRIHAKHVLMVFDSCFSGAIFQITRAKTPPFIEEKVARPVRQFLTAGQEDEQVPDRSFFKTVFLQGVRDLDADLNRDGYVTGQELGAYLQEKVINYSRKAQHPQYGKINNPKLDKGDFVLVAKPVPREAPSGFGNEGNPRELARKAPVSQPQVVAEKPLKGRVSVTSNVDGALFELAGRSFRTKRGVALVIGGIPAGEHAVVAKKEGYPLWKDQVVVRPDQTASLAIRLAPEVEPAKVPVKEAVLEPVKGWTDALNNRDREALLSLFTDDARIMTKTKKGHVVVSKQSFEMILDKKMRIAERRGFVWWMGKPQSVEIKGSRASVDIPFHMKVPGQASSPHEINQSPGKEFELMGHYSLVKQGKRWLIEDFRFEGQ